MWKAMIVALLATAACLAQPNSASSEATSKNGSISGTIKDENTGAPVAGIALQVFVGVRYNNGVMSTTAETREVTANSDDQGHYRLSDLPPGQYRVNARSKDIIGPRGTKSVKLTSGQDIENLNFLFPVYGAVSGKVLDQNKEPVPGATVYLLSKEYEFGGSIRYFYKRAANTDDQGEYRLDGVEPGTPLYLMAMKPAKYPTALSDAPLNGKLRKWAFVPTYFPGVDSPEGAAPLNVMSAENREGVDIRLLRSPSYCLEGSIVGGAEGLIGKFTVAGQDFMPGIANGGGLAMFEPSGPLGADGKLRVCGLRKGAYRVAAIFSPANMRNQNLAPVSYGFTNINIVDQDIHDLKLVPEAPISIPGSVAWDTAPPDQPVKGMAAINLQALSRAFMGGNPRPPRSEIPGDFIIPDTFPDAYRINVNVTAPNVYVKDVVYGTKSVRYEPMMAGSAPNVRIILAHDGGSIAVQVADKDGNALSDAHVAIMPAELESESAMSWRWITGDTDQDGNYNYGVLGPGKYLVLATAQKIDRTVDRTHKLWLARGQAKMVELSANAKAQVKIELSKLD